MARAVNKEVVDLMKTDYIHVWNSQEIKKKLQKPQRMKYKKHSVPYNKRTKGKYAIVKHNHNTSLFYLRK